MDFHDINQKRQYIRMAIEQGTSFLFSVTGEGVAPAKKHDIKSPGIWTSAEMLEFLLTNKVLPSYSIAKTIEQTVDYIISKYDETVSGWALPASDPPGAFSAITSGHCIFVLKLYLNKFTTDARRKQIIKIINNAETSILSAQDTEKGYWIPKSSLASVDTAMNYGKLFYSVHAYFGIKKVSGYDNDNSFRVANARKMANLYFVSFANSLIKEALSDSQQDINSKATLLAHAANLIQVLSDIDVEENGIILNKLLNIVHLFEESIFTTTTVQIYELPANTYNNFHLNTAFNVFFALLNSVDGSEEIMKIIDWYLKHQDPTLHCWYLGANSNSGIDTWSTCEALLVLGYAYTYYFEEYYQVELAKVQERFEYCDECKREQNEAINSITENVNMAVKKIKRFSITSTVITIISVVCAVVAVLILSEVSNNRWLNLLSTVIVIPAIFQIASSIKLPDLSDIDKGQQNKPKKLNNNDQDLKIQSVETNRSKSVNTRKY
jgi:hypothetical protein